MSSIMNSLPNDCILKHLAQITVAVGLFLLLFVVVFDILSRPLDSSTGIQPCSSGDIWRMSCRSGSQLRDWEAAADPNSRRRYHCRCSPTNRWSSGACRITAPRLTISSTCCRSSAGCRSSTWTSDGTVDTSATRAMWRCGQNLLSFSVTLGFGTSTSMSGGNSTLHSPLPAATRSCNAATHSSVLIGHTLVDSRVVQQIASHRSVQSLLRHAAFERGFRFDAPVDLIGHGPVTHHRRQQSIRRRVFEVLHRHRRRPVSTEFLQLHRTVVPPVVVVVRSISDVATTVGTEGTSRLFLRRVCKELTALKSLATLRPVGQHNMSDLAAHAGIVYIPYQVSTMSMLERNRMNMTLFVPAKDVLVRWHLTHAVVYLRSVQWNYDCSRDVSYQSGKNVLRITDRAI